MKLWSLIAVVLFLIVGAWLVMKSNERDAQLNSVQDCVVEQAHAQGYTGNPYSQEAWELFAGNCQ